MTGPVARAAWHPESLAGRLPFLRRRAALTRAVRGFFLDRGYLEVETPYAVPAPGEEVHLRAFETARHHPDGTSERLWLHTSPEFAMKRLLVAGAGPIFQFARVWRNGEGSALHAPEFTMLEWYRPGAGMDALIEETFEPVAVGAAAGGLLPRGYLGPVAVRASDGGGGVCSLCRRRSAGDRGGCGGAGRRRGRAAARGRNLGGFVFSLAAGAGGASAWTGSIRRF